MSGHSVESDALTKQPGEGQTAFSVRLIQNDAWCEGHDAACPFGIEGRCWVHYSPYRDEAVATRDIPPANPTPGGAA